MECPISALNGLYRTFFARVMRKMKVLAVSFDEYRDSGRDIRERVEIFGEFSLEGLCMQL